MTADHPDGPGRPRPTSRTGTGRHRTVPAGPVPVRGQPEPARAGDTGPTRRLREPAGPGGGPAGNREPADRPDRPGPGRRVGRRGDGAPRTVRPAWPDRLLRGLAGILAGGMAVLALGMVVVWVGADRYGLPGPGADVVIGHLVGAVVAVVGQRVADRRPDRSGTVAALVVVAVVMLVLGFAWFL